MTENIIDQLPNKKMIPSIRRFVKEFADKIDCTLDSNQLLVDPTAKLMYDAYLIGRRELSPNTQCYIIGGITEQGLEFALSPVVHSEKAFATSEGRRLRKKHNKPFFVFSGNVMAMELLKEMGHNKKAKTRVYQGPATTGPTLSPRVRKELKLLTDLQLEINSLDERIKTYGMVIRGMDYETRTAYFESLCVVFGEKTRDYLTNYRPTSILIQEDYFLERPPHFIDGYQIADRYTLNFLTDAVPQSVTVSVQDYTIPVIHAETELLNHDRLKAMVMLKRVLHTHLTSMINQYNGTRFDLQLPLDDPNYVT